MPDVSTPAGAPGSLSPPHPFRVDGRGWAGLYSDYQRQDGGIYAQTHRRRGRRVYAQRHDHQRPGWRLPSQYDLEVIESLPGFFGSPSVNLFPVAITPMALNALSPSASSGTAGTAFSSTLSGMQSGSQLAILRAPPGYSLSGGVLSRAQGPTPGGDVVIIREINPLANTYRDTTLNISAPLNLPPSPPPPPPPSGNAVTYQGQPVTYQGVAVTH